MESFILLASPNKNNVQQALQNFMDMCKSDGGQEPETNLNVGAILGSARAYLLLKQTQKAKAQLKRIISYPWSLEEADYLQQCNIYPVLGSLVLFHYQRFKLNCLSNDTSYSINI